MNKNMQFLNDATIDDFCRSFVGDKNFFFYKELDSTNEEAIRLIKGDKKVEYHGAVIMTTFQYKGRGRGKNSWFSPYGMSLYTSFIFYPHANLLDIKDLPLLSEQIAGKFVDILNTWGIKAQVKSPNDIYVAGKKLAGILCESSSRGAKLSYLVIGLGLNLFSSGIAFPDELQGRVSSLEEHMEKTKIMACFEDIVRKGKKLY